MSTLSNLVTVLKQQRLAWSCAIVVGLFLIMSGRAPLMPVLAGCSLAVTISVLRSWSQVAAKSASRGSR